MTIDPRKKSTSTRHSSTQRQSGISSKFIPNLTQLQEIVKELPAPEEWTEDIYTHHIVVEKRQHSVDFTRKKIQRGNGHSYRWVYEGKILIRKRDS